jgi:hypothetical protein
MARTADHSQCSNKKKIGDYCAIHSNKQNITRIDEELKIKKKRTYTKKLPVNNNSLLVITKSPNKNNNKIDERYYRAIVKIQSFYRGYRHRKYDKYRGPALWKRKICNNNDDIYTTEEISKINPINFFSLSDKDGFVYGFDLETIYTYISINANKNNINNPYNNNTIPDKIIGDINRLYEYSKSIKTYTLVDNTLPDDPGFILKNLVLKVFQKMDELNNYTDIDWFYNLTSHDIMKLVNLVKDLWNYRMELTIKKKLAIIKTGRIFENTTEMLLKKMTLHNQRMLVINEFEKLVFDGNTRDDQYLGSLIILIALVELSKPCALAYPWLVQSSFGY